MVDVQSLHDSVVKELVTAINTGDRDAFSAVLTDNATMSDDGTDRDLREWTDREIFSSKGNMVVESESDDGLSLVAQFSNAKWGTMRTKWKFFVTNGKITRFETGQA